MHNLRFNLLPGGKKRAVTFSYDDGRIYDKRLAELFDKYGAKCTFNLNAQNIGKENYIDADFVKLLSEKHEVAIHAYTHPFLNRIPAADAMRECYEDKCELERITGLPIVGMAYPFGVSDKDVLTALCALGIKYSRTTADTHSFGYPDDFLRWNPTCHHRDALADIDRFLSSRYALNALYIWGHSYEFNNDNNWELMEEILSRLSAVDDIWYATNAQLYEYYRAIKELCVSVDGSSVYNPTAITVYATDTVSGGVVEIKPGMNMLK